MATTQIVLSTVGIGGSSYYTPADRWDGQIVLSTVGIGGSSYYTPADRWDGQIVLSTVGIGGSSYYTPADRWDGYAESPVLLSSTLVPGTFQGYCLNWDGQQLVEERGSDERDNDSVIDYPKTQFIYYKLKGFNKQTCLWESWIVKNIITARPEQFQHLEEITEFEGRHPPNFEKDIFKSAPSANELTNVTIVGRWIE